LSITDDDPRTVREVVDSEDGNLWKRAMEEEMASLDKNEAWDLVELIQLEEKPLEENGYLKRS
jgi:hypothetical protein